MKNIIALIFLILPVLLSGQRVYQFDTSSFPDSVYTVNEGDTLTFELSGFHLSNDSDGALLYDTINNVFIVDSLDVYAVRSGWDDYMPDSVYYAEYKLLILYDNIPSTILANEKLNRSMLWRERTSGSRFFVGPQVNGTNPRLAVVGVKGKFNVKGLDLFVQRTYDHNEKVQSLEIGSSLTQSKQITITNPFGTENINVSIESIKSPNDLFFLVSYRVTTTNIVFNILRVGGLTSWSTGPVLNYKINRK